jgi:alginate export protein
MRNRSGCGAAIVGMALQSLAFVYGALPASAQAPPPASELQRPALQIGSAGRFNEDWSVLRGVDLSATDDLLDRLKFIPFTNDGSVWLSLGGQARERGEYFRHYLFGASEPKDTDAYLLSRFRLSADLHVTPYLRMFAEGKSSMALDRDLQGAGPRRSSTRSTS